MTRKLCSLLVASVLLNTHPVTTTAQTAADARQRSAESPAEASAVESDSESVPATTDPAPTDPAPTDPAPTDPAKPVHQHTNRLAKESSPYLLQHAHNPVDWYPWGDEAFAKARRENKMVFLSVGYAACHWCHVMERETFEDAEIAALMNDKFVCIKVDREERPDVDQIYMTAVQMISGNGGWPMSVFLLPDAKPFWGGTYFPARTGDRGASTGFLSIIQQIDQAWQTQSETVTKQAQHVTTAIAANQQSPEKSQDADVELDASLVSAVATSLDEQFDPEYGGFGFSKANDQQPKFPEPSNLVFLLDRMERASVSPPQRLRAKEILIKTLDGMVSGAMIDHIGGGFHRYSVDRRWQIPHFEKMLYDNGQLASVYANAAVKLDSPEYRDVATGICDFVLRELRADGGAFYAALDADSEGEEGKFYRWTHQEIADLGGKADGFDLFAQVFRLTGEPNFEGEYFAPDPRDSLTKVSSERGLSYSVLKKQITPVAQQLLEVRSRRERPLTDIKILTAWNGLMIAGLADTGRLLGEPKYIAAAGDAADFVIDKLTDSTGRLQRSYARNAAKLNAYVDDYAFLVSGLIALHRATEDTKWLKLAQQFTDRQVELFWDNDDAGFFFTSSDHATLIVRVKDPVDSAIPSGSSVTAENLLYLSRKSDQAKRYHDRLRETLRANVPLIQRAPAAAPRAAAVMAEFIDAAP